RPPVLSAVGVRTLPAAAPCPCTTRLRSEDGDALSFSATGLPAFATLSGTTLTLAPGFEDAGSYPVTVQVSDGSLLASQSFTIVVGGTNRAPVLNAIGDQALADGATRTLTLTATDEAGDALSFSATGLPAFATL